MFCVTESLQDWSSRRRWGKEADKFCMVKAGRASLRARSWRLLNDHCWPRVCQHLPMLCRLWHSVINPKMFSQEIGAINIISVCSLLYVPLKLNCAHKGKSHALFLAYCPLQAQRDVDLLMIQSGWLATQSFKMFSLTLFVKQIQINFPSSYNWFCSNSHQKV